jgi:hypothetical protein
MKEHETSPRVRRHRELEQNLDRLDPEELEEFQELSELLSTKNLTKEVEGKHIIHFRWPNREKIITARKKDKLIRRALCFLGTVPSTTSFFLDTDGSKRMSNAEVRRFIENL